MKHRLEPIATEEGARELLQRLVDSGKCKIEDFDTPSPHWQENVEVAAKYHPNLEIKPYRNLLREQDISERVQVVDPKDLATRSNNFIHPRVTQILRPQKESICAEVDNSNHPEEQFSRPLPF